MKRSKIKMAVNSILIFVMAFGLQISGLVAGNTLTKITSTQPGVLFCPECPILLPTVPMEAPFAEMTEFDFNMNLEPEVPMEAQFDEEINPVPDDRTLSPMVPLTAGFCDSL